MTFMELLSYIIGADLSPNTCAWIFTAFVIFGLYSILALLRGAFHK